jgi:hypothetical protein
MLLAPFLDARGNKNIGATIRIGQEIWCLPYEGFFACVSLCHELHSTNLTTAMWIYATIHVRNPIEAKALPDM